MTLRSKIILWVVAFAALVMLLAPLFNVGAQTPYYPPSYSLLLTRPISQSLPSNFNILQLQGGTWMPTSAPQADFNLVRNPVAWGAVFSSDVQTATLNGTNKITVDAVGDFAVGQPVGIPQGGAATSIGGPAGLTVTPLTYSAASRNSPYVDNPGCNAAGGNANCTTSYYYKVLAIDSGTGISQPSAGVGTAVGPATLSTANSVKLTWTAVPNAQAYQVCEAATMGGTFTTVAFVPALPNPWYRDYGNHWGSDEKLGSACTNHNQDFAATITAISGNTLTLSAATTASGSGFKLHHDNGQIFNTMISTMGVHAGFKIEIPAGGILDVVTAINLYNTWHLIVQGDALTGVYWGSNIATLRWSGSGGGMVINGNFSVDNYLANLLITGSSTPSIIYYSDSNGTLPGGGSNEKHNILENVTFQIAAGADIDLAPFNAQNGEFHQYRNVFFEGGGWAGTILAGLGQTYNLQEDNLLWNQTSPKYDMDQYLTQPGSVLVNNPDYENAIIDVFSDNVFGGAADGNLIETNVVSEQAQYHYYNTAAANRGSFLIIGGRLADTPGDSGAVVSTYNGGFSMQDVSVCPNAPDHPCYIGLSDDNGNNAGNTSTFVGNLFQDTQPYSQFFNGTVRPYALNDLGNKYGGLSGTTGSYTKQSARITTGSIGASATAAATVSWPLPFYDQNYSVNCSVEDTSAFLTVQQVSGKGNSSVSVMIKNTDGAAAHTGALDCIANHDFP